MNPQPTLIRLRSVAGARCCLSLALLLTMGVLAACQSTAESSGVARSAEELRASLDRADEAFNRRAYDQALESYKAIYIAASSKDLGALATEAAAQVATTYATTGESGEGGVWMERAEAGADEGEPLSWTRILLARGLRAWRANDPVARSEFAALYNFCFNNRLTPRAIQAASLAALVSEGDEQLSWMERAIQAAKTTGNAKWEAPLWSDYAWLLEQRGKHAQALEAFDSARQLTGRAEVPRIGRLKAEWAYAHGLRMVGRLEEAADLLEQSNARTRSVYLEDRSPRAAEFLGRVLTDLAEIDVAMGRSERARERLTEARALMVEAGALENAPQVVEDLDARLRSLQ